MLVSTYDDNSGLYTVTIAGTNDSWVFESFMDAKVFIDKYYDEVHPESEEMEAFRNSEEGQFLLRFFKMYNQEHFLK